MGLGSAIAGEWIPLFNGKDLDDWMPKFGEHPVGENLHNIFRVKDGLLKVSDANTKKFDGSFGHLFDKIPRQPLPDPGRVPLYRRATSRRAAMGLPQQRIDAPLPGTGNQIKGLKGLKVPNSTE